MFERFHTPQAVLWEIGEALVGCVVLAIYAVALLAPFVTRSVTYAYRKVLA